MSYNIEQKFYTYYILVQINTELVVIRTAGELVIRKLVQSNPRNQGPETVDEAHVYIFT